MPKNHLFYEHAKSISCISLVSKSDHRYLKRVEERNNMGLLNRMATVIKAKMSKIIGAAEDPRETLDYSYEKQLDLLQNVKRGVAEVATSKTRLQLQKEKLNQNIQKLDSEARDAVRANREDLARLALDRKNAISSQIAGLDQQIADLGTTQAKLEASEQRLSTKIEVFRTKKETIKAEYSAADAQVKINESVSGISEEMADIGNTIERAENKTDEMKARSAALDELIDKGTLEDITSSGDDIERELAKVSQKSNVESELAKLKSE
jgi:phage shock protein A